MNKAGHPFGEPMSAASDAINWVGSVFQAYGAELVDKDGNITVKSDATRQVLDWFKRLMQTMPQDTWAWDNAGNNKFLISGKGSLIQNPPSAWAVAKRDAPQVAEKCWSFPPPKGPKGRFIAGNTYFFGAWKFSQNQGAAKDLIIICPIARWPRSWSRPARASTSRPSRGSSTSTPGQSRGRRRARSPTTRRAATSSSRFPARRRR